MHGEYGGLRGARAAQRETVLQQSKAEEPIEEENKIKLNGNEDFNCIGILSAI